MKFRRFWVKAARHPYFFFCQKSGASIAARIEWPKRGSEKEPPPPPPTAWLAKTRRTSSRHSRDARVHGHTTTAMHKLSTPPHTHLLIVGSDRLAVCCTTHARHLPMVREDGEQTVQARLPRQLLAGGSIRARQGAAVVRRSQQPAGAICRFPKVGRRW